MTESLFNATTAVVLGQVGFLTLVIILVSVAIGLFLDRTFETLPWMTIILVLGSIPVSLLITVRTVKRVLNRHAVQPESDESTMTLNEAPQKKKKKTHKLAWISIGAVVVLGFVFSLMNPPVRPEIKLAAEHLTHEPLFGNVYFTNTMVMMVLVDVVVLLIAFAIRRMVMNNKGHVPEGRMGAIEAIFEYIYGLTEKTAGKKWVKTSFSVFRNHLFVCAGCQFDGNYSWY